MNLYKFSLAIMLGAATLTSCSDKLELTNPNDPTTGTFGKSTKDLEDAVKACYHHMRMGNIWQIYKRFGRCCKSMLSPYAYGRYVRTCWLYDGYLSW